MAWVTAEAVKGIPDLEQYNVAVDKQVAKVRTELDRLEEDVYFENMSEVRTKRWEEMLKLTPKTTDTLDERRFAIQSRVIDKLPYSYRVVYRDLQALVDDVEFTRGWSENGATVTVKIGLSSESMLRDIDALLDKKLPLDVVYEIIVMYNSYDIAARYTHEQLAAYTHGQIRSDETLAE